MTSIGLASRLSGVVVAAATTIPAFAQSTAPEISRGLFTTTPVLNAPFSAAATTTITETRKDGTTVQHTVNARYYRDSTGRVRIESKIVGAKAGEPGSFAIVQTEPGDRLVYVLDSLARTAVRAARSIAEGTYDPARTFAIPVGVNDYRSHLVFSSNDLLIEDIEQVGERRIEGLAAVGRRMSRVGGAGVDVTAEWWESPDLQVVLSSRLADPRIGSVLEFRLTNIRQREPAASLFVVPENYTLKSGAAPDFSWRLEAWSPRVPARTK